MTMGLIFWVMMLLFFLSLFAGFFGFGHYVPIISSGFIFNCFCCSAGRCSGGRLVMPRGEAKATVLAKTRPPTA